MIDQLYDIITQSETEYVLAEQWLSTNHIAIMKEKSLQQTLQMAKAYVMRIGENAQNEVKNFIEDTVTFAVQIVYGDEYSFESKFFYDKRDQFEIKWYINRNGNLVEPRLDTISGGLTDVCAFSLRLVIHSLEEPEPAPILIVDEPFKNTSQKYIRATSEMVGEVSHLLNLQIIMCSHKKDIITMADNVVYLG